MGMDKDTETTPSIGVDFYKKSLSMKDIGKVRAQFWDTAGQEKYRSLSVVHARGICLSCQTQTG